MNTTKPKVSVYIAASLDGYIARPDGDVSWLQADAPLEKEEDFGYYEFFNSIDVLVMGRGSFEKVMEFDWPYGTKPVIVLSQSLTKAPHNYRDRVRVDSAAPQQLLEKLSQEGYQHIYLDGGKVIQSFLRAGLIHELTLTTVPILIGAGIPLFGRLERDVKLRLLASRSWENGYVQAKYEVQQG